MPKSKRAKVIHLSKVRPKSKADSDAVLNAIRSAINTYENVLVFSVENMRNIYLKELRSQLQTSRIFFSKTKIMAKALGTDEESEVLPGLSRLTAYLEGEVGLLFTHEKVEHILQFLEGYIKVDYSRAGTAATRSFTVPEGVIYSRAGEIPVEEDVAMAHSIEPTLRAWGMPTRLVKGKITLDAPYDVCSEAQILNSHQTALLKMFGVTMAEFRLRVTAYYNVTEQKVVEVDDTHV